MDKKQLVAYTAILGSVEGLHRPRTIADSLCEEGWIESWPEALAFVETWMPVLRQLENWLDLAKALAPALPDFPNGEVKGLCT